MAGTSTTFTKSSPAPQPEHLRHQAVLHTEVVEGGWVIVTPARQTMIPDDTTKGLGHLLNLLGKAHDRVAIDMGDAPFITDSPVEAALGAVAARQDKPPIELFRVSANVERVLRQKKISDKFTVHHDEPEYVDHDVDPEATKAVRLELEQAFDLFEASQQRVLRETLPAGREVSTVQGPSFSTTAHSIGEVTLIAVTGSLRRDENREELRETLLTASTEGRSTILDLSEVSDLDASAIGTINLIHRRFKEASLNLVLVVPESTDAYQTLKKMNFTKVFSIAPTREQALERLSS